MDDSLFKGRQIKVHYTIVYSCSNGYFENKDKYDLVKIHNFMIEGLL